MQRIERNVFAIFGRVSLVLFMTLFSIAVAQARPELGPPSIKLRTNLSKVVVAQLDSLSADHKLTFSIQENLHNEAEQSIIIRSDALTAAQLGIGQTYVIAIAQWDVQRFPRVVKPRRDGAVIISLPGAMPAIFPPNSNLIELLTWDLEASRQSPDAMLAYILHGMSEFDPQLQNFFTTELVTRPRLYSELTRKQRRDVAGYLADAGYSPLGRNLMLGDAVFSEMLLSQRDRLSIARDIVVHHSVQVDFGSHDGSLIRTAMKIMENAGSAKDAHEAQRWLRSNQPTLVESAASIIFAIDPESIIGALEQASEFALLEQHSRDTLANLLRRYRHSLAANQ